jgi:hypothetical protein
MAVPELSEGFAIVPVYGKLSGVTLELVESSAVWLCWGKWHR